MFALRQLTPGLGRSVVAAPLRGAQQRRTLTQLAKTLYTAHGQATGQGRNGKWCGAVDDQRQGEADRDINCRTYSMPKELGGSGKGQNPEQLFALGYGKSCSPLCLFHVPHANNSAPLRIASCFLSALNLVARQAKATLPSTLTCQANVSIGPPSEGPKPFALAVELLVKINDAAADKGEIEKLVQQAHEVCPYSNATRGNVPVKLTVE